MDSLSAGAFQEVINAGNDKQFVAMLLQMDEALVGVYHLLQVDILLHDVGKGIFGVIFFIHADDFFQGHFGLHHNGGEDAAREVAAVGDEVNVRIKAVLQLFERLLDFGHMLVLESFVDAHVVVAPAEVARGARFHTGAGTSGNGVHHDIIVQHQMFGERQQAQLYAGGKAARIGYVLRFAGGTAVQLRQAVDEVVFGRGYAVVHGEVDDSQFLGHVVAFEELLRVTMCRTEKSTSISSSGSWSVNTKSVSPYSPSCTSVILLPALLELFMKTISASGWLSSKRISSPAVYPAPPMIPTLIISIISIWFLWYNN